MKRILAMILCCLLLVEMCGCGNSSTISGNEESNMEQTSQMSKSRAESLACGEVYRICADRVLLPASVSSDMSDFNFAAFETTRDDDGWDVNARGTFWSRDYYGDLEDKYTFNIRISIMDNGHIITTYKDVSKSH